MHLLTPFLALAIDEERRRTAARQSLARLAADSRESPRRSSPRRRLALGLAAVSRISAGAVRRLDACLADDLARTLAPTDGA